MALRPLAVDVAHQFAPKLPADRYAAELGALTALDLQEGGVAVTFNILQGQGRELADSHPGAEQDLDRDPWPALAGGVQDSRDLLLAEALHFLLRHLGRADPQEGWVDRVTLAAGPIAERLQDLEVGRAVPLHLVGVPGDAPLAPAPHLELEQPFPDQGLDPVATGQLAVGWACGDGGASSGRREQAGQAARTLVEGGRSGHARRGRQYRFVKSASVLASGWRKGHLTATSLAGDLTPRFV